MKFKHLAYVVACVYSLVFPCGALAQAEDNPSLSTEELLAHPEVQGALAAIDAWIEGVRIYEQVPGMSVGFVHGQDMIWNKGYGYSNLEDRRPADENTIYSICSISKLFTSIGVMQLRDAGKLRLDDPVAEHLDWFDIRQAHAGSAPITIEGLLTHSSGLPRESDFPYWAAPEFPFPTRQDLIERLSSQETLYPSAYYFQYSNLGLTLAGEIVQERSGEDFADYVTGNILQPLGLSDTRPYYPEDLRGDQLAIGYTGMHREHSREPVEPFFTRGITPAAGFTSTVNDLAKFASWQFRLLEDGGDEILRANTLREMQRVHYVDPDWETTWGLGFGIRRVEDTTIVGHGGGCPGYITSFRMVPDAGIAAIVLTNAGDGPAGNIADNMLQTIGAALKAAGEPSDAEIPDLSMYEGNYEVRPWGGEIAVRQWGEQLVVIEIPRPALDEAITKLEFDGDNAFTRLTDKGERREPWVFEIGAAGNAERILVHSIYYERID